MSVLASEQITEQIIIASIRGAVTVTAMLERVTHTGLAEIMNVTRAGFKRLPSSFHLTEGKMTLKRLQHASGGDLHAQEISPELIRSMQRDLKKRGVDFAVEHGTDGKRYIHFKGADVDTISHAFRQVQARLDSTLSPDKTDTSQPVANDKEQVEISQAAGAPSEHTVAKAFREARSQKPVPKKPQTRAELTAILNKKIAEQKTHKSARPVPVRRQTREARS